MHSQQIKIASLDIQQPRSLYAQTYNWTLPFTYPLQNTISKTGTFTKHVPTVQRSSVCTLVHHYKRDVNTNESHTTYPHSSDGSCNSRHFLVRTCKILLTRLLSSASAQCSSFCLKQFVHLVLLKMLGENFLHSPERMIIELGIV